MPFLRFIVLLVTTACLTQLHTNINIHKYTQHCTDESGNYDRENFTSTHTALLEMAPAFGTLAGLLPIAVSLITHPKKQVFLVAAAVSTVATAIVPICDRFGFSFLLIARMAQGVGLGVTYPMVAAVTWQWAALNEHGLFLAVLTGFPQLSRLLVTPVADTMCESAFDIRSVSSLMALSGLVIFSLFAFFYQDSPADHPMISTEELAYIEKDEDRQASVPFKAIFSSATIWSCLLSALADILAIQFISAFFYQHFNAASDSDNLLPVLLLLLFTFRVFSGLTSDSIKCVSETNKLRVFNTLGLGAPALCFVTLPLLPPTFGVTVLMVAGCLVSLTACGFYKSITQHARQHAHIVMIVVVLIHSLHDLIVPSILNSLFFVPSNVSTAAFVIAVAVVQIVAVLSFLMWADAEPAEFTKNPRKKSQLDLIDFWQE